jgi:hypothetical protein
MLLHFYEHFGAYRVAISIVRVSSGDVIATTSAIA